MTHASTTDHGHGKDLKEGFGGNHGAGHVHVVPMRLLIGVFVVLMLLTGATFAATWVNLGYNGNLILAMAIAVVKAALVMLYFMHLRWDKPFNAITALSALFFIAIFIIACIQDSGQYKSNYERPGAGYSVNK